MIEEASCIRVVLRQLQQPVTTSHYSPASDSSSTTRTTHHLSVLVFSDAGRQASRSQLSYIAGLLMRDIQATVPFHLLSWSSHKSRRTVRSIRAAEILAAVEAIDEGKILARTLSSIYSSRIPLLLALDSRDLFTSLSTERNSVHMSS